MPQATTIPMDNQDILSNYEQIDSTDPMLGVGDVDLFNDSGGADFFDKFLADEDRIDVSTGLAEGSLFVSANDSTFEEMLDSTLQKSASGEALNFDIPKQMEVDNLIGTTAEATAASTNSSFGLSDLNAAAGQSGNLGDVSQPQPSGGQFPSMNNNWIQTPRSANSNSLGQSRLQNSMLDAAPLHISLGGQKSSNGIAATLRSKGSSSQLGPTKLGAVRKAHLTSSKLRSAKSEGMLARALKAKYSGSSLNKYNANATTASAIINAKFPQKSLSTLNTGASSGAIAQHISRNSFYNRNSRADINAVEIAGSSGGKNATWGTGASRKPGASLFANILSGSGGSGKLLNPTSSPKLGSSSSAAALLRLQQMSSSGSRSSMQDLLRLSKKQSKTQTILRQSSAHSLMKQTSSQNLKGVSDKVDLTSLLPPHHTALHHNSNHGSSPSSMAPPARQTTNTMQQQQQQQQQQGEVETTSLLHQSCRLYPTTAAVVESALRIDSQAIRKAIPVSIEKGQAKKPQHVYGYPVNIAMTHGGSNEVIKMLADAGPDVLVQKDGNDGSGSLGIALMNNANVMLVDMLIQANPECVKVADRRGNYPLHVAVNYGRPLDVVKKIHGLYPEALKMSNFHSQTPLDIAQVSTRCSEDVMNFLQTAAFAAPEQHTQRGNKSNEESNLEDGLDDIMETNF